MALEGIAIKVLLALNGADYVLRCMDARFLDLVVCDNIGESLDLSVSIARSTRWTSFHKRLRMSVSAENGLVARSRRRERAIVDRGCCRAAS